MEDIFFKVYNRLGKKYSNYIFRGILKTPPIATNPSSDAVLYCALNKPNCRAYILAAKSFLRYCPDVAVVVQDDGSLGRNDIDEIKTHLPGAAVFSKQNMFQAISDNCPDSLLSVLPSFAEYNKHTSIKILFLKFLSVVYQLADRKVVIIDSDLIFLRRPDRIIDWIHSPYAHDFYGEGANENAAKYYEMGFKFPNLDIADFSSGTIGVGGRISNEEVFSIFDTIRTFDPNLFLAWEIEQAVWAIVLSERSNPLNLDELREVYIGSGWRSYRELREKAVIAHFAGAIRFKNLRYVRLAYEIINDLRGQSTGCDGQESQ